MNSERTAVVGQPAYDPRMRRIILTTVTIAATASAVAACGATSQNAATTTTVTVTSTFTMQPTITDTETVTYTPPPPPGPKTTIDTDGTYQVGVDIVPGTYRSAGGSNCYWARLNSLSTNDIIDNNGSAGPQVVEIQATDKAFQTEHCAPWQKSD